MVYKKEKDAERKQGSLSCQIDSIGDSRCNKENGEESPDGIKE